MTGIRQQRFISSKTHLHVMTRRNLSEYTKKFHLQHGPITWNMSADWGVYDHTALYPPTKTYLKLCECLTSPYNCCCLHSVALHDISALYPQAWIFWE